MEEVWFWRKQVFAMFWYILNDQGCPLFIGKCFGFEGKSLDMGACYYPMDFETLQNVQFWFGGCLERFGDDFVCFERLEMSSIYRQTF